MLHRCRYRHCGKDVSSSRKRNENIRLHLRTRQQDLHHDAAQSDQAVAVACALAGDIEIHSRDEDGTELTVHGDDYLNDDGSPDFIKAMNDLPDPELLLRIECVSSVGEALSVSEAAEITDRWPEDWRERR